MSLRPPEPPCSVLPVIQETLEVGREHQATGAVRVRKEVQRDQVPFSGVCVRETVHTERVPVNRPVDARQAPWQTQDALVIPVYEERLVRQLFLTEELHVKRRRESTEETGMAELRRDDVVVERLDPETQTWVRDDVPPEV